MVHHQSFDKLTGGQIGSLIDETFDLVGEHSKLIDYDALRSCYLVGIIDSHCIKDKWITAALSVLVVGTVIETS